MPFDINDYNLEDIFTFNEMYAYMCKTKRHENSQYQQIFEGQREHLEPNYLPKQILMLKHKRTKQLLIVHIQYKKDQPEDI